MRHAAHVVTLAVAGVAFAVPSAPARAGLLDSLFGSSGAKPAEATQPARGQREWLIKDYTTVRLVPREAGSTPNQQPVRISADALRQQLQRVKFVAAGSTGDQPLFSTAELGDIVEPLAQAFENAGPNDDVLLLSSARRGGLLAQPYAVTARLFAQNGSLQMIVNDARYEFYNQAVGSRTAPTFTFGSRGRAGSAAMTSDSANTLRADWLAMPIGSAIAAPAVPAPPVGAGATVARPPAPAAPAATATAPAAPLSPPTARPRDAAFGEEQEQRLLTLKRLREKGLLSEEEYQQKRKEILSQL